MKKLISVVISAYNEEAGVEELSRNLIKIFGENQNYNFEVIIVENGSRDNTIDRLLEISKKDERFKILQLSKNFGMDGGISAGLSYAKGEAAVIMAADLQDPPDLIPKFIEKWEEGYENVYGIVKNRPKGRAIRQINSVIFYKIIHIMSGKVIPENVSDFRLVDKKVYQTFNEMNEHNRFIRGMFAWAGFKSIGIEFERKERFAGKSQADFISVFNLAVKGIFAYSYVPIRFISVLGFLVAGISLISLLYFVIKVLIKGVPFPGYGTLVALMLLMFGFMFLILGILGQYIAQIYEEVKGRPNYIIKKQIGFGDKA